MYVWPCIIYEKDERYQLDATIMIYYHKKLYVFRTSICPSSGVQVVCCCVWCSALGVVAVILRSRCVVLCTVHKTTHRLLRTTATTPSAEHHMQQQIFKNLHSGLCLSFGWPWSKNKSAVTEVQCLFYLLNCVSLRHTDTTRGFLRYKLFSFTCLVI